MQTHVKSRATLQRTSEPSGLKGSLVYFEDESGPWTSPGLRGWDKLALTAILDHPWETHSLAERIEEGRQHNAVATYEKPIPLKKERVAQ
jgi:hypothetical protein